MDQIHKFFVLPELLNIKGSLDFKILVTLCKYIKINQECLLQHGKTEKEKTQAILDYCDNILDLIKLSPSSHLSPKIK